MTQVFPSLLAADFLRLANEVASISMADGIHLDIMDGVFVPNISFGPGVVEAVRRVTRLPLHSHLMIVEPWKYLERFKAAGSDLITVHLETIGSSPKIFDDIKKLDAQAGLTFNPDTSVSASYAFLPFVDQALIMSVFPGFGGQKFLPESLARIEELAEHREREGLSFSIAIDGGIGRSNAGAAISAGADLLVAGTSVFGAVDRAKAIDELRAAT